MSRVILKQITAPNLLNTVLQPRFGNPTDPSTTGMSRTVRTSAQANKPINIAPPVEFRIGIGGFIYIYQGNKPLCRSSKHINDRDGLTKVNQTTGFLRAPGSPAKAHVGMVLVYDIIAEAIVPPGSPDGDEPGAPEDSDDLVLQPFPIEGDDLILQPFPVEEEEEEAIAGLLEGDELPLLEGDDSDGDKSAETDDQTKPFPEAEQPPEAA